MCSRGGKWGSPDEAVTCKRAWGIAKNLIKAETAISKYTLLENPSPSWKAPSGEKDRQLGVSPPIPALAEWWGLRPWLPLRLPPLLLLLMHGREAGPWRAQAADLVLTHHQKWSCLSPLFIQNRWAFEKPEFAFVLATGARVQFGPLRGRGGGGSGKEVRSLAENFRNGLQNKSFDGTQSSPQPFCSPLHLN